jgi:hypothetical protein
MKNINYIDIPISKLNKLKQFIRGSLLGDGSIPKKDKNSKNYRMTFGHGPKQKEYLMWKHAFLEEYLLSGAITKRVAKSERYKTGECVSYHFKSKTHPIFTNFRNLYYSDKRFINKKDIVKIDEFALAIWYMDDGNITRRKKRSPHIELNTQSFLAEDVDFLVNLIQDKWNVRCARMSYSNIIRISSYDCQKFLDIIEPYKIDCLAYKWVLYKEDELLES